MVRLIFGRNFASEKNAAPKGMWVQGGEIELSLKDSVCSQEIQAQYKEFCSTKSMIVRSNSKFVSFHTTFFCFFIFGMGHGHVNNPVVVVLTRTVW